MTITFNTNLAALGAQRNIGIASNNASSSLSKLSSGSRIPQAKDDAAGLAIGSKLKAEVAGLTQASNNAAQAISLLQIADGSLSNIGDMLVRMKALAVQSSSGQLSDADRSLLNQEFSGLKSEVDRVANTSNFNGTKLLSGAAGVFADVNNLGTIGSATAVKNLIGQGVSSINFASSFTAGAAALSYNANGNGLTLTNLITGQSETVDIGSTAIASGETQTINFSNLSATVVLNSSFDKTVSSNVTNGYRSISYGTSGAQAAKITSSASNVAFRLKDSSGITAADFDGAAIALTATLATASTITVTVGGNAFSIKDADTGLGGGTIDLTSTGAKSVTLIDANGDELDVDFTVATAFTDGNAANITLTTTGLNTSVVDINANATQNLSDIQSSGVTITSGTGAINSSTVWISDVSFDGTGGLKASDLDGVVVNFGTLGSALTAATMSATVNGHTFNIKDGATIALSTNAKTVVMEDNNGNEFTIKFTVGTAFNNSETVANITLAADHLPATSDNSVKLLGVTKGADSTFNFGNVDSGTVTWTTTTASTSTASMTLNGMTFTSGNIDLTSAGLKTVTLTNGSGASQTSITYQFSVTTALDDADTFTQYIGEMGQVVGANAQTGGSTSFAFKVGTGTTTNDSISFSLGSATTSTLAIDTSSIATKSAADSAIGAINAAITTISSRRADVGAAQSRLDFASNGISVAIENTTAAQSALLDVDVSAEITKFTSQNVLLQAGISLLSQANQQPALLLRLLQ